MWEIEINWQGKWIVVATGFATRDDAEWEAAKWKQANRCAGDPFRATCDRHASITDDRGVTHCV